MNNEYDRLKEELKNKKCKTCGGLGKCDDADFGDIWFRTWTCSDCNGTGINEKQTEKKK